MKKFLGIIVLGLLWCNVGVAGSRIEKLPKDVVSGDKFSKANNKYNTYKKYGMQVVDKKDGHPVRAGNKSIRFEVRAGDCGQSNDFDDCADRKERHELAGRKTISVQNPNRANFPVQQRVHCSIIIFHSIGRSIDKRCVPPIIRGGKQD